MGYNTCALGLKAVILFSPELCRSQVIIGLSSVCGMLAVTLATAECTTLPDVSRDAHPEVGTGSLLWNRGL